ncbi:MAG: hypothetical protein JST52_03355 [Bacteroidetes bacterium]|nr:hypothetical protein [Bacteroidota bacterium]MBS1739444.1 hypothetical protein [Bacteroidota bacterium]MBS1776496.1 hypothetical protein [Bacteroidota bacterium]
MKKLLAFLLIVSVCFGACRKKEDENPAPLGAYGKLKISIQNMAGTEKLKLDSAWYKTEHGDSLKAWEFKYYFTNIELLKDSTEFREKESYYLVNERQDASKSWIIDSIPTGTYTKIRFLIGVDEARNTSGAQTGALDPGNGMFWDWNSGYIMAMFEGISPSAPSPISYHITGFSDLNSVLRTVTLTFPTPITIKAGSTPNLHLKADLLEWFKTPYTIDVATLPVITTAGASAMRMANNYADMFSIDRID